MECGIFAKYQDSVLFEILHCSLGVFGPTSFPSIIFRELVEWSKFYISHITLISKSSLIGMILEVMFCC